MLLLAFWYREEQALYHDRIYATPGSCSLGREVMFCVHFHYAYRYRQRKVREKRYFQILWMIFRNGGRGEFLGSNFNTHKEWKGVWVADYAFSKENLDLWEVGGEKGNRGENFLKKEYKRKWA